MNLFCMLPAAVSCAFRYLLDNRVSERSTRINYGTWKYLTNSCALSSSTALEPIRLGLGKLHFPRWVSGQSQTPEVWEPKTSEWLVITDSCMHVTCFGWASFTFHPHSGETKLRGHILCRTWGWEPRKPSWGIFFWVRAGIFFCRHSSEKPDMNQLLCAGSQQLASRMNQ